MIRGWISGTYYLMLHFKLWFGQCNSMDKQTKNDFVLEIMNMFRTCFVQNMETT